MFSRDHGFVFFLPMHPPRGPSPASLSSSAPHTAMDLGCFSATQHLPHCCWSCIHLHQSPLAWVIPRTLWPLPPCPYHTLHVLWRVQGPRPGCQRRRAPRDELHDCHFLNKFVLDMLLSRAGPPRRARISGPGAAHALPAARSGACPAASFPRLPPSLEAPLGGGTPVGASPAAPGSPGLRSAGVAERGQGVPTVSAARPPSLSLPPLPSPFAFATR